MLIRCKKEITKDQYERAWAERNGYITDTDMEVIFGDAERFGYGIYSPIASKEMNQETGNITYVVNYTTSSCCD